MKKQYIIIGVIFLSILTTLLIMFYKLNYVTEDEKLKNQIIETVNISESIDFSKITNFEWDTMYIFTPYSKPEDILNADRVKSYNSNFKIEVLDNINMIAFVNSNKLIAFVELPRDYMEADINRHIKFSKNESKFSISNKAIIFH
jgi:hypothetical protein